MPMSASEIEELQLSMQEAFEEIFEPDIHFLEYSPSLVPSDTDVYEDLSEKAFKPYVELTGRVSFTGSDKVWDPSGVYQPNKITFGIPLSALASESLDTLPEEIYLKSRISYRGTTYRIMQFVPTIILGESFLKLDLVCEKIL